MAKDKSAFPLKSSYSTNFGLSRRDYHASAFLQSMIEPSSFSNLKTPDIRKAYVKRAFEIADTFLTESEKQKQI